MLVDDDPAFEALFENHGPAGVQMRRVALLGSEVEPNDERGPRK